MEEIVRKAYAKINLGLDVIRRRPDGYHEVKMIMQTISLHDELRFEDTEGKEILLFSNDNPLLPENTRDNLIYKAADCIRKEYGIERGVKITLQKNIPIAAGMAGGSTDAAAVFHGLNDLWNLSMSTEKMQELSVRLGADIPYCIMGGTALSEGIGEILTSLPAPPDAFVLIAKPDISVSTKFVYENLHADTLKKHPDIDGMIRAIRERDLRGITGRMENVLETVTEKEYPVISRIKERMKEEGALNALMSGSGPTVFGIFEEEAKARKAEEILRKEELSNQIFVTTFVNNLQEIIYGEPIRY